MTSAGSWLDLLLFAAHICSISVQIDHIAQHFRLAAVMRHTCIAAQAAELHFPTDKARLTGRREAALDFALQNADRVVRLGSLTAAVEDSPFSASNNLWRLGQLAAFRRVTELELGFPVPPHIISLLTRGLRRLTLEIRYR